MPLLTLAGLPGSGKTTVAKQLERHFQSLGVATLLINEESLSIDKVEGYRNSEREKLTRGSLKSAVDHALNTSTVVILDSLNYIKGFRYELYCIARGESTQHCVVWVQTPADVARRWNANRENGFSSETFEGLIIRFEAPIDTNRWDKPVFEITPDMLGIDRATHGEGGAVYSTTTPSMNDLAGHMVAVSISENDGIVTESGSDDVLPVTSTTGKSSFKRVGKGRAATDAARLEAQALAEAQEEAQHDMSHLLPPTPPSRDEELGGKDDGADAVQGEQGGGGGGGGEEDVQARGIPFEAISNALLHGKVAAQSLATVSNRQSDTNFLYELDQATQEIVAKLVEAQHSAIPGDVITVPRTQKKVHLCRKVALPELRRLRRQFIKITKGRLQGGGTADNSGAVVGGVFVDYINTSLEQ